MIRCPQCGQYNEDNFKYCGKCGSEINSVKFCQFCNAQNNVNNTSCINCGKPFDTNVISQPNQENYNYQQHTPMNSNKLDLKALFAGSISTSILFYIISMAVVGLNYYRITSDNGSFALVIIGCILSGTIGMIIFNKINREEKRQLNIIFVSILSSIMILVFSSLIGGEITNFGIVSLIFVFILMGAFIGDYVERNGKL